MRKSQNRNIRNRKRQRNVFSKGHKTHKKASDGEGDETLVSELKRMTDDKNDYRG
jgi:hypothetical protein